MVPASSSHLKKIRTFAQDIESARASQHKVAPSVAISPVSKPPILPTTGANVKNVTTAVVKPTPRETVPPPPVIRERKLSVPSPVKKVVPTAVPLTTPQPPVKIVSTATRDTSYPATIITDTKTKRFRLTAAIGEALTTWWNDMQKARKKPTYTVPAAELRRGIIEKATTTTARAATQDHTEIVARLKAEQERRKAAPANPLPVVTSPTIPPEPEVAPQWESVLTNTTPVTNPVPPIVPTVPTIQPMTPPTPTPPPPAAESTWLDTTLRSETVTEPEPEVNTFVAPLFPPITPSVPVIGEPEVIPTIEPKTITKPITPVVPDTPESIPTRDIISPAPRVVEENLPTLPASMQGVRRQIENRKEQLQSAAQAIPPSNTFVITLQRLLPIAVVAGVVLVVTGVIGYYLLVTPKTVTPTTPTTTTNLPTGSGAPTALPTTSPLGTSASLAITAKSKTALYTALASLPTDQESLQLVSVHLEKNNQMLYRDDLLNLLSTTLNVDFRNNIGQLLLGSYRGNPTIIIKITDKPGAQGALFLWEKTMSYDLSPWFGRPVTGKSTSTLSNFTDSSSGGKDVRVLKNSNGDEQITYGFANANTIVITNTTTSFLNIASTYVQ